MPHPRRRVVCRVGLLRLALFAGLMTGVPGLAAAGQPVTVETIVTRNPAQHLFVARIDLGDPRVEIVIAPGGPAPAGVGPWETTLQLPSLLARDNGLAVAVNGGFFQHQGTPGGFIKYAAGSPARATDLVIIDGQPATRSRSGVVLAFDAINRPAIASADTLPPQTRQAIGGSFTLVAGGVNVAPDDVRHPRTAAGLTADGKTLVLLVADGSRSGWAAGLTPKELADAMIARGCASAVNLDGGGSSTMVRRTPAGTVDVVNTPSDGSTFLIPLSVERPVAYVLGVRIHSEISNQPSESNPKR